MAIATHRVFGIAELLEDILLDEKVDVQTLLLAQRVDRTFYRTINDSTPLQEKLFMRNKAISDGPIMNHLFTKSSIQDHLRIKTFSDGKSQPSAPDFYIRFKNVKELGQLSLTGSWRHMFPAQGRVPMWVVHSEKGDLGEMSRALIVTATGCFTMGELMQKALARAEITERVAAELAKGR